MRRVLCSGAWGGALALPCPPSVPAAGGRGFAAGVGWGPQDRPPPCRPGAWSRWGGWLPLMPGVLSEHRQVPDEAGGQGGSSAKQTNSWGSCVL